MSYRYTVEEDVFAGLTNLPRRQLRKLERIFTDLAAHPFTEPDLKLREPGGEVVFMRYFDDIEISYVVDHAVKKVRVLDVAWLP